MRTKFLLAAVAILACLNVKAQEKASPTEKKLPADYPVMKNSGNTEQDNADYAREKEVWVSRNKEKYNQYHNREVSPARLKEQQAIREQEKANSNTK
jgi:hypothetical protein